jgi:hypothetical protein
VYLFFPCEELPKFLILKNYGGNRLKKWGVARIKPLEHFFLGVYNSLFDMRYAKKI